MTEEQTGMAFQDFCPEETQYCYGCRPRNAQGLDIQSYWDGDDWLEGLKASRPGT